MKTTITLVDTTPGAFIDISGLPRILAGTPLETYNLYPGDLQRMTALLREKTAGTVTVDIEYSADELASGLLGLPQGVGAISIEPMEAPAGGAPSVDSDQLVGGLVLLRALLVATGASGTIVDTTLFTVDNLPDSLGDKFRVVDAWAVVETNLAADNMIFRTQAAGAGDLLATVSANAAGYVRATSLGTANVTPQVERGATEGLFVRRDRSVVAEVFLLIRKEK